MRARHLTIFILGLGIFAAASELRENLSRALAPRIELGELQPGIKIYFLAKNETEETDNRTLAISQLR